MKAEAHSPRALFDGAVHYEIPVYQRPYVWTEDEQWSPLWDDIRRLAGRLITASRSEQKADSVPAHFLGAVVLKSKPAITGDVTRYEVVDGQQRLTTLQLLMAAARGALLDAGSFEAAAEAIAELTSNSASRFKGKPEQFKLRPSRGDRSAFEAVLSGSVPNALLNHRLVDAHDFFRAEISNWLVAESVDEGTPEDRAAALFQALEAKLQVVGINLNGGDDDQLIFETLNDRGTPLLKADLIKNWIFQKGEALGAAVEEWADNYWAEFDDEWWREEVSQGRHLRSRIDTFLQYWLTMRTASEVQSDTLFATFRSMGTEAMDSPESAQAMLEELLADAALFRELSTQPSDDLIGRFYDVVVRNFELATVMPLLLRLASPSFMVPPSQCESALRALESWVVRRTLIRGTMKDVNKLVLSILQTVQDEPATTVGSRIVDELVKQTAEVRYWPTDRELLDKVPSLRMYGNIRQNRLRVILEGIEKKLRGDLNESVSINQPLEVEHIFPQKWRRHWDLQPPRNDEQAYEVDVAVNTLGNLTLVTSKLNGSLSNRPWTDREAQMSGTAGVQPGMGKRSLIGQYSLLVMNRKVVDQNPTSWDMSNISERSLDLTRQICRVWPGPPMPGIQTPPAH